MELYIHIPFCIRKCAYCDFLSGPADAQTQDRYMEALLREVGLAGELHRWKSAAAKESDLLQTEKVYDGRHNSGGYDRVVNTIFIGGGTPSAVDAGWMVRLMEQVRRSFVLAEDAEITMEANPGTLTAKKLAQYRHAGINRLSIGLQSTDDGELKRLGRIHTYQEFLENYRLAREAGFTNINIDLMSALPGQTVESYERTLRRVIALKPEHISAYSLLIEEGTPYGEFYNGTMDPEYGEDWKEDLFSEGMAGRSAADAVGEMGNWRLPTEDQDRRMYHLTKSILAEGGYERYEISNYSRPGYICRHNVGYWTRVPYLGLGLGAASFYGGQRFTNTREMEEYLSVLEETSFGERTLPVSVPGSEEQKGHEAEVQFSFARLRRDVQNLTAQDAMEEFMFLGLRLTEGVSAAAFESSFGQSLDAVYGPVLEKMQSQSLMERAGGCWRLTELGVDVSNYVLARFLL